MEVNIGLGGASSSRCAGMSPDLHTPRTLTRPHEWHICGREDIGDGEGHLVLQINIKDRNVPEKAAADV